MASQRALALNLVKGHPEDETAGKDARLYRVSSAEYGAKQYSNVPTSLKPRSGCP